MKFKLGLALISACLVGQLSAGTLTVFSYETGNFTDRITAANTQLNTLRIQNGGTLVDKENFEGFTASKLNSGLYTTLNTGIGTFTTLSGNEIGTGAGNKSAEGFTILDSATTPFNGRYNINSGGKNWLDSNDNTKIGLAVNPPLNNLYFFVTDEGDQGGTLTVKTSSNSVINYTLDATPDGNNNPNGTLYLVFWKGLGNETISNIEFLNSSRNDGFGLDRFGTIVPEPGFYYSLAVGFAGLGVAIRRRKLKK